VKNRCDASYEFLALTCVGTDLACEDVQSVERHIDYGGALCGFQTGDQLVDGFRVLGSGETELKTRFGDPEESGNLGQGDLVIGGNRQEEMLVDRLQTRISAP
jgi:hypothetical protein